MKEIAFLFLKLGMIAFGGPVAHIAMMEDEVVRRRKWVSQEQFLDLVGATNLIPGPFIVSCASGLFWNVNAAWIVGGSAVAGWILSIL